MSPRFQGIRAVVTGAGHGIGRAVARKLADEGAAVAVLARSEASAEAMAEEIVAQGGTAVALAGDLARPGMAAAVVSAAIERLDGVDLLINAAGWTRTQSFLEDTAEYWDTILTLNLRAVLEASQVALAAMLRGNGGAIVNVASDAGRVGMAGEAAYAAAKGGVIALTKSLAQEVARRGVRVNCVCPGPTRTRVLEENADADAVARVLRRIPLGRPAEPEEVAAAVLFLASSEAAMITGQVLSVSGGLTMV
jgi:2-hydroxycyclohexanecarboxyl-CoA dehydrogenase